MNIYITPEQIEYVRNMLLKQRNRYQPKFKCRNTQPLTDDYIIQYITRYIDNKGVRNSKYCNVDKMNDKSSFYKIYKKFNNIEMNERLKLEAYTGYVSFN